MRLLRFTLVVCLWNLGLSASLLADDVRPGFACPRPVGEDVLSTAICTDASMARAELTLEKTYYAHRLQDGPSAYQALKVQAINYDKAMRNTCSIPASRVKNASMPPDGEGCYIATTQRQVLEWNTTLKGAVADEASRDLSLHIMLQQRLANADFLSVKEGRADGVYGDATRNGIRAWQEALGFPITGAIADDQVTRVMALGTGRWARLRDAAQKPSPSGDSKADPLVRIFQPDMLHIQPSYLEAITGPTKRVETLSNGIKVNSYVVTSCELKAYVKDNEVDAYDLIISPNCTVDLTPFEQVSTPTVNRATFGDFATSLLGNERFRADCLSQCGNAANPLVGFVWSGSHAEDYINIEAFTAVVSSSSIKAWMAWGEAMSGEGNTYIESGRFNCGGEYQQQAVRAFRDLPITEIFVGFVNSSFDLSIAHDCAASPGGATGAASASGSEAEPTATGQQKLSVFGTAGRFTIIKGVHGHCGATTRSPTSDDLTFLLDPKPMLVLTGSWNIPPGTYPVGIDWLDPDGMQRTMNVPSLVNSEDGRDVFIPFQNAVDVEALVTQGWIAFHLGDHQLFFNTGGQDAVRMLPTCAGANSDPFASVH